MIKQKNANMKDNNKTKTQTWNQKTKYIDNSRDLFSLLDEYVKNQRDSIIISAGAGEISNQIRFFYDSRK